MKTLGLLLGLIVGSYTAQAAQNVFLYRTVLIEQSRTGTFCPQIVSTTAVNERDSFQGKSVYLTDRRGIVEAFAYTATTNSCENDQSCETENQYEQMNNPLNVNLKRDNNGDYPKKDLPGYRTMTITFDTDHSMSCTYMFY